MCILKDCNECFEGYGRNTFQISSHAAFTFPLISPSFNLTIDFSRARISSPCIDSLVHFSFYFPRFRAVISRKTVRKVVWAFQDSPSEAETDMCRRISSGLNSHDGFEQNRLLAQAKLSQALQEGDYSKVHVCDPPLGTSIQYVGTITEPGCIARIHVTAHQTRERELWANLKRGQCSRF